MDNKWNELASKESVEKTLAFLKNNGIEGIFVENGEEAFKKIKEIIPEGAEVMTMTSVTLDTLGITQELNDSGKYNSVRKGWEKLDKSKREDAKRMQQEGAAPDWVIGSVHAVTEDGRVLIASNTGSQMAAYVSGASNVVWVVGAQKLVKNKDEGEKRIYEYVLPRETLRARKAYELPDTFHSNVSILLLINKVVAPNRVTLILVNEVLGF